MRRVRMIAPFDVLRGNVSGSQKLQYAKKNNPAFDAPEGRQYARNYKTRYICAERASDGRTLFQVRRKSATVISEVTLLNMALLGGAGALYAAVLKNESVLTQAIGVYNYLKRSIAADKTFRQWLTGELRMVLRNKMSQYVATASYDAGTFNLSIDNPWVVYVTEPNCPVSKRLISKFWDQLAADPIEFFVQNAKGVAHLGEDFGNIVARSAYNVLGLTKDEENHIMLNGMYVVDGDTYVVESTTVVNSKKYSLTSVEPE